MSDTIGVRLNNPGNLEWGSPWQGLVPREQSRYFGKGNPQQERFCEFVDAASGIRAIAMTLITYYDKRQAADGSKIDTVREIVERWAPSFENNVEAYSDHVSREAGKGEFDVLDLRDYDTMRGIVKGIIAHENHGYAYPDKVLEEGLRRAGFVPKPAAKTLPMSVETLLGGVGPIVTGAVMALPELLPQIAAIVQQQHVNLSSGNKAQFWGGILAIVSGCLVTWSQYKRRKAGAA